VSLIALIDDRQHSGRRFEASLHGMTLLGDTVTSGAPHNRSHSAMERMKQRRAARGC
jgi:hypothetical protein